LNNNKSCSNLVNEYLEKPNKSNITVVKNTNKDSNRARGKRLQNTENNGLIKTKANTNNGDLLKKIVFKSFDKRKVLTNFERREGNFEDPISVLHSSSTCHNYNHHKYSAGKSSSRGSKTGKIKRRSKVRNSSNAGNYLKIVARNSAERFMK